MVFPPIRIIIFRVLNNALSFHHVDGGLDIANHYNNKLVLTKLFK